MSARRQDFSRRDAAYLILTGVVSAHFCLVYATATRPYLDLERYFAGAERLPFQFRALTAWVGAGLHRLVEPLVLYAGPFPRPFDDTALVTGTLINMAALFAATVATASTIERLTGDRRFARLASFLVPLMGLYNYVLMVGNWRLSYPYDLPQLALFALCLHALVAGRMAGIYACVTLAALNRETAVFLLLIVALYRFGPALDLAFTGTGAPIRRRLSRALYAIRTDASPTLAHLAALTAIVAAARLLVYGIYAGNPLETQTLVAGVFSLESFTKNLRHLGNPGYWPSLLSNFAFLWIPLLVRLRRVRPAGLRYALLVVIPWFAGMAFVGTLVEMRVFGELVSLVALAVAVMAYDIAASARTTAAA